jgi:hypothetical protein
VWSCVARVYGLQDDPASIHCDLVLGTRPAFQLDSSFAGSPTMMLNIEMPASAVSSARVGQSTGSGRASHPLDPINLQHQQRLAAHLHSIAFERSLQRIWQTFLGRRHILVTTWARASLYDVDFSLGSWIRYADGVVPCLDDCTLIVNSTPVADTDVSPRSCTESRE